MIAVAVARLPVGGDNVAIACRRLERGTIVAVGDKTFALDYTVLEGHRFAVARIAQGASLLSWGLPFGYALRDIGTPCSFTRSIFTRSWHTLTEANFSVWPAEGTYVINQGVLEALHGRHLDFELPHEPNFYDEIPQYELNRETFVPTPAVRDVSCLYIFCKLALPFNTDTRMGWPTCTAVSHRRGVLFHGI